MSMQLNPITGSPVLKWIIVIALVFAPLQGVMSAPGHDCHADYEMNHEMTMVGASGNGAHASAQAAVAINVTQGKCCDHCDNNAVCDVACNTVHIDTFLIGFAPLVVSNLHLQPQAQVLEQLFSQLVSPLLHPPQT